MGKLRPDGSFKWKDENSRLIARRVVLLSLPPATGNKWWAVLDINIFGNPLEMGLIGEEPSKQSIHDVHNI
ncbi:hypothetical protein N7452_010900 [Penicillium brevicompactum]|uniref:Uncharacterized protein n=1 Tax=Penicillium brevicompactum TaxID=5074 RepID=A0A9W9Q502_PENBR|nr:hypothetical protein N7452_010900 [Penicillium brevicompactum]